MGSAEGEGHRGPGSCPLIASISSHTVPMAKQATSTGAEGVGRKKPSTTPYTQVYVEHRIGRVCTGLAGEISKLGERKAVRAVGGCGMADLQLDCRQDLGGSE